MRSSIGIAVAAVIIIAAFLVLQSMVRVDPSQRNLEFIPEMVYSPAQKSLSESRSLPGGITQQHLVRGVVIRGGMDFPYGSGPEEAARAGRELENPFDFQDAAARERGAERFGIFCAHCHGANGIDPGPVPRRGMVPPPSFLGARAKSIKDGEIFHIITKGQGNMGSHAGQIPPDDRWKIVLHVRSLQAEPK